MNRRSTEDFHGNENILHGIIMMDVCLYKFVQAHRMYNTKSEALSKSWTLSNYDVLM